MNKSTKGAIAAGAAAALLLGGAGTLAYWNAEGDLGGGSITAGTLTLTESTAGAWTLNGEAVSDISSVLVVPGDTLVYTGAWTIGASGDNLEAEVSLEGVEATDTLAEFVDIEESYTVGGTPIADGDTITGDNDGDALEATVTIDFDYGTTVDNDSQGTTLDLSDASVTLTQLDPQA